jgi:phosphomannomutase
MKISISGIRGIFGQDLTLHDVLRFVRAFSELAGRRCVLARDTRESSRIISEAAAAALMEQGVIVHNLGIAPTPFAFREARKYGSALIVTASHNPLEWNGMKFVIDGRGIFEEELQKIQNISVSGIKSIGSEYELVSTYPTELINLVNKIGKNVKAAIDTAGGAASCYADDILSKIGCSVTSINNKYGMSSSTPDPTTDELSDLRRAVVNGSCAIGFAFDLDGDRLVVMDKDGVKLPADLTLLLCVAKAIEMRIRSFVVSVDTSRAVEVYAKERNCKIRRAKVGEANVVSEMLKHSIPAGGEGSSGGFILKDFNMCRDGMLASALISTLIGTRTYDECIGLASEYRSVRGKVPVDSSLHMQVIEGVRKLLEKDSSSMDYLDGVLATIDDNSYVLVRGSNTEDSIRISVESKSMERSKALYNKYEQKISEENEGAKRKADN